MDIIRNLIDYSTNIIANGGVFLGVFLIIVESLIPIIPLSVIIALNVNAFGFIPAIFISWISTCLGCYISYSFFYYFSTKFLDKIRKKHEKQVTAIKNISLVNLTVLVTLPFTPAFLINILAGIVRMPRKKFLIAIIIGKIFMVSFWGYVGKSFIESITDMTSIIIITIMVIVAYIISKLISKKSNIE